eukprot:TRINITY_DN41011_c0_g1_i1.p1 TRINITY_DN41011_c0_g1~~TRINITY_DN41011_c0_g1_i1.p1  ORF type:complete len:264 (+),score=45.41 TRINITY_DN41011_c0_g1_i1:32-793(+)
MGDRRHAFWERQVHATVGILASKGHMTVDEMRRCVEAIEPHVYARAAYYEKWAIAVATLLLERRSITNGELDERLGPAEEAAASAEPFAVGAVVRVRSASHATRWRKPHLRTPGYVHGMCGVVTRQVGTFANPEKLAFGGETTQKSHLYVVQFEKRAICDFEVSEPTDEGAPDDAVTCEIYHTWLEAATEEALSSQRAACAKRAAEVHSKQGMPDCKRARKAADGTPKEHREHRYARKRSWRPWSSRSCQSLD